MDLPLFAAHQKLSAPKALFHYTSPSGLEGILRSKKLWATSLQYVNDAEELTYARLLVRSQLERRAKHATDTAVAEVLAYAAGELDRTAGFNACAFSLSEKADLLSQWRGYCPSNGGYSIGFAAEGLRRIAEAQGLLLGPCLYQPEDQLPLVEELVEFWESGVTDILQTVPERGAKLGELALPGLFIHLSKLAPFIKSGAYAEEVEWRLVFARTPLNEVAVNVRVGRTMLVPYAEIDFGSVDGQVIGEIVVGPCAHSELSMKAVGILTTLSGNTGVRAIRRSNVPFRSF